MGVGGSVNMSPEQQGNSHSQEKKKKKPKHSNRWLGFYLSDQVNSDTPVRWFYIEFVFRARNLGTHTGARGKAGNKLTHVT